MNIFKKAWYKIKLPYYAASILKKVRELQRHPEKIKYKKFVIGLLKVSLAAAVAIGAISEDVRELLWQLITFIAEAIK